MKKCVCVLLVFLFVFGLTACGGSGTPTQPSTDSPSSTTPAADDGGEAPAVQPSGDLPGTGLKIGFAEVHYTNPWRIAQTQSIIDTFEAQGFEVVWNEANKDTATQIANVNDLLAQGIDYLIIVPNEPEGLLSALAASNAAGVPVFLIDRTVNGVAGTDFVTYVGPKFRDAGVLCGEWLVSNYPDGANIVIVAGPATSTAVIEHQDGFSSVIESVSNINVLAFQNTDYSRSQGQSTMENMLQAYGDQIDLVFTESDELCFGVIQAMRGADYEPGVDIKILSSGDGGKEIVNEIIKGTIVACAENTPISGPQVCQAILDYMAGKSVEPYIKIENRLFTKDNAQTALDEGISW